MPSSPGWPTADRTPHFRSSGACESLTKFLQLNLPCYHPLAVFLPRLGTPLMLLLNRVRSCASRNLPNPNLLASKRCFLGGTDTSGGLEKPCGNFRGC